MAITTQLDRALVDLEEQLELAKPRLAAIVARRCMEGALKHEVCRLRDRGSPKQRKAMLERLGGERPLDDMNLGQLFRLLERYPPINEKQFSKDFRRFCTVANKASHDNQVEIRLKDAVEASDFLWETIPRLGGLLPADIRPTFRARALARLEEQSRGGARTRPAEVLPSALMLDRREQRRRFEASIPCPARGMTVVLLGEVDQGHGFMADYCLTRLRQAQPGDWERVESLRWPHPILPEQHRFGSVLEDLDCRLELGLAHPLGAPRLAQGLLELLAPGRSRLFLQHRITVPELSDVALVGRYLDEVWTPVVEGCEELALALTFELVVPASGAWWFGAPSREARRAAKAARKIAEVVEAWAVDERRAVVVVPELCSLSVTEIDHCLPDGIRDHVDPSERRRLAQRIWASSGKGRFEKVVEQLHLFARSGR